MRNESLTDKIWFDVNNFISNKGLYLILASAAVVFIGSLSNDFVWDDWVLIVPNEVYKTFDIKLIFLSKANSLEYLPFRDLTLAIDYQLWGTNPFGYHFSNLLFYLLSLIALYKMVKILVVLTGVKEGELIPFWATLIFALHPLHVEAVNFISARNNILAGLFLFISFNSCITGIREKKNILIFLSALLFIIALFSKASVVFYPFFLAVILFLFPDIGGSLRKKILVLLLFCVMDLIAVWIHFSAASSTAVISENMPKFGIYSPSVIIAKALQIPFFYLKMLVFPYPLSSRYIVSFGEGGFLLFLILGVIYLLIILCMIMALKRRSFLPFSAAVWYFLSLGPVLNIFPTSPVVADRYAYFAVLSFGLLFAYFLKALVSRRRVFIYIALGVVMVWGYMDVLRSKDWNSDLSLWESALAANPDLDRSELAIALWNERRYEEALAYFKEERDRKGSYEYNLYKGKYFYDAGQYDDAIIFYKKALAEGAGALKETHLFLAQAYEKIESDRFAMQHYLKVFDAKSQDPLGEYSIMAGNGLNRIRNKFATELAEIRGKALDEPANFQAQLNTALLLYELGMYSEAEEFYLKSLKLIPLRWDVWYNLGVTYMKLRRYKDGIGAFDRSLELKPKNRDALRNIGIIYMNTQDYSQAAKYFKIALELDPDFLYAAFNLGKIYLITGDKEKAREYFLKAKSLVTGNDALQTRIDQFLKEMH